MARNPQYNAAESITEGNADAYLRPAFPLRIRMKRLMWNVVWTLLYRLSPRPLHGWRTFLLRSFGARMGPNCHFYPKSKVWAPWNLLCGDQVTAAAPPPASVAVNCSWDVPWALVVLQPVQLVSMEPVPGAMLKAELEGSAATCPSLQPATTSRAGTRSKARARRGRPGRRGRTHLPDFFCREGEAEAICALYGKIPRLLLMLHRKGYSRSTTYKTGAGSKCDSG